MQTNLLRVLVEGTDGLRARTDLAAVPRIVVQGILGGPRKVLRAGLGLGDVGMELGTLCKTSPTTLFPALPSGWQSGPITLCAALALPMVLSPSCPFPWDMTEEHILISWRSCHGSCAWCSQGPKPKPSMQGGLVFRGMTSPWGACPRAMFNRGNGAQ